MSLQLLIVDGKAAVCDVPREFSSEDWGDLQNEFLRAVNKRGQHELVGCVSLWPDQKKFGIYWSEALAGPNGVYIDFWVPPDASKEQLKELRAELRWKRDVVKFYTSRIKQWVDGFRPDIAVDPAEVFAA